MSRSKKSVALLATCFVIISVFLSSVMGLNAFAAKTSGSCGEDLKWSFSAGTLTITGEGKMQNYNEKVLAPWYELADKIISVKLPKKLESIGMLAFYNCTNLKAISIPEGTVKIADKAFYNCTALLMASLPESLTEIGRSAFYNCEKLCSVSLPSKLEVISDKAFFLCRSIPSITVPTTLKTLGKQAFAYCESLLRVEIKAPLKAIPEWCFYGCKSLAEIKLPDTVTEIDDYAFKRCDNLYTVYHSGDKKVVNSIRNQISQDVPSFNKGGYVSPGDLEDTTQDTTLEDSNDKVNQTTTSVTNKEGATVVTQVESEKNKVSGDSHYEVHIIITVNGDAGWTNAILTVRQKLTEINASYAADSKLDGIRITLYLVNTNSVNEHFLKELAGRKILLEVITENSSSWLIDCSTLKFEDVNKDVDASYTVSEPSSKIEDELGTDDCYQIVFDSTTKTDTNVVISLPNTPPNSYAYLYQITLGKPHKLQTTVVDSNSNAHFYLSSISKGTKYVVGVNVPGESKNDAIIPDSASDVYGAIARLEKIEYVSGTQRTLAGFTLGQIILIVMGVLVFIAIVIGIVMFMLYKQNPQRFAVAGNAKPKSIKSIFKPKKK